MAIFTYYDKVMSRAGFTHYLSDKFRSGITIRAEKSHAIILNMLLIIMYATYCYGHGLPNNWILWSSAILWLVAPIINLIYIKNSTSNSI